MQKDGKNLIFTIIAYRFAASFWFSLIIVVDDSLISNSEINYQMKKCENC